MGHGSHVMVGEEGGPLFPFSWTPDPKATVRVDSRVLPPLDREVLQALECFFPLEFNIFISRDREDGNIVEEYIGKSKDVYFYWRFLYMGAF